MNREIKFRGKRIDNGEWVYGDLLRDIGSGFCIMPAPWYSTVIFEEDETEFNVQRDGRAIGGCFPVVPETVGEFTGLRDKNGKEIYEGDVLGWISSNPFSKGEKRRAHVYYIEAHFWCKGSVGVYLGELLNNEKCEVIGNIHENPELLA